MIQHTHRYILYIYIIYIYTEVGGQVMLNGGSSLRSSASLKRTGTSLNYWHPSKRSVNTNAKVNTVS